jgi:hypothetical protein
MSRVWLARDCIRSEECFQEPLCSLQSTRIKSCISHIWAAQVSNTYVSLFTVLVYHCHLFLDRLTTFLITWLHMQQCAGGCLRPVPDGREWRHS